MRLADSLIGAVGGEVDRAMCGMVTTVAAAIGRAQKFIVSDEVADACRHVAASRPSTLLSALPYVRVPYKTLWIEYSGRADAPGAHPDQPNRVGCLIECSGDNLAAGAMTWAWRHNRNGEFDGVNVGPIGALFDWRAGIDVGRQLERIGAEMSKLEPARAAELNAMLRQTLGPDAISINVARNHSDAMAAQFYRSRPFGVVMGEMPPTRTLVRQHFLDLARRNLRHARAISPDALVVQATRNGYTREPEWQEALQRWSSDISGEYPFVHAFLTMLNAKNGLERQPVEDLSKLNRCRAKRGKPPLCEFIVTRLALSNNAARSAQAHGISREAARRHMVRGHFKARASGIFWWHPHLRGHGAMAERQRYEAV
jgi:hypothetical protein